MQHRDRRKRIRRGGAGIRPGKELHMNGNELTKTTAEMWDRIFRIQKTYDEQAIVRFIRMVVAGCPEQGVPEPQTC